MPFYLFFWTDEIIEHLALHDVGPEDFEAIVSGPEDMGQSHSSDRLYAMGFANDGRHLFCVYELIDESTILPITAYEIED